MALPYFREFGWEAEVIAVRAQDVEGVYDPLLLATVPATVPVHLVQAISPRLTRRVGLGSLVLRSKHAIKAAGNRLLSEKPFDLVYFSTTMFGTMTLGPYWRRRFGVPYMLDFQDPWLSDYYAQPGAPPPPGGRLRYGLSRFLSSRQEPLAVKDAAHIVSVSPKYPEVLRRRYPELRAEQCTVLPFGAPEKDFEAMEREGVRQELYDPQDGRRHFVYVGRGGQDMAKSLRILFRALKAERAANPAAFGPGALRLHFVGTSYAPKGMAKETIAPVAREEGVADQVEEITGRIPYFQAMRLMRDADAIMVIGSDDSSYTASKIYPCVLARRPILGVFHEESSAAAILRGVRAGEVLGFRTADSPDDRVAEMRAILGRLAALPRQSEPPTDWQAFAPYTAREMTRRQCEAFDKAVAFAARPQR